MKRTRVAAISLVLVLELLVSACGGTDNGGSSSERPANRPSARSSSSATKPGATVDACKLLTEGEIEPYLGTSAAGQPGSGVGESVCEWKNAGTEESVTLSVGAKGTAADGRLDPASVYGETER